MKILYLDCYSGISGDMFLGALIDAGLDISRLRRELARLPIRGYRITVKKVKRGEINSTKFDLMADKRVRHKRRTLKDILSLIENSKFDSDIKDRSSRIFKSLAQAECNIHRKGLRNLHFHEVGDIDSIVDVVGAVIALKILGIEKIYSSRVNIGGGATIATEAGILPIPAPAALYLLKDLPISYSDIKEELVTPTGAALLVNLVDKFEHFPDFVLRGVGYGAGGRDLKERPNCLRIMMGELKKRPVSEERILVIEANIDDMNPVDYEYLMERLFKEGALDVYLVPVQMKKTRPGILLTILARKEDLDKLSCVIFSESTTIGIRYYEVERKRLKRKITRVCTKYGDVRVKVSEGPGGIRRLVPEYEDCRRLANSKNIPLNRIRKEAEEVSSRL